MDNSWWSAALATCTAAGALYLATRTKVFPQLDKLPEQVKSDPVVISLREELESEHGEIISNSVEWKDLEALIAEQNWPTTQIFELNVLFRESDRDKIYYKLQRKGFSGNEIKFFDKPFLIVPLRVCELHRLEKLPVRYRLLGPAGEQPVCV